MNNTTPENIALFDLDGTLADYNGALQESMATLRSSAEPKGITPGKEPAWYKNRERIIKSKVEFWSTLPQLHDGFKVLTLCRELGFDIHILTKGPDTNSAAWMGKHKWFLENIRQPASLTITADKGLVYGRVLVDDYPEYVLRWLKWRPRGLAILPARPWNKGFKHRNALRYDSESMDSWVLVRAALFRAKRPL